ncbi:His-Xaa-Ser system radical SAM maturase HxsB [Vibrio parahaemolyticus]|uniref:His-Xaa-Ser system radical SAM maturase HxsB n=1 Tax=Vibrio parahaemolyticus TaxID=670 RepID=UPI001037891E|nr:His-Xaa-Ser system radical SAM maturase HxsB [Vibrio parahaemolyticus]EJG1065092.1 His-Xaa-Ser system radical SAM maturase HxsB [Vibrio parahaemolyticus O1]EIV8503041.1 His-Xaa-Ser system radical SAM maturase HxsB [Vibrio parahaemolyticus]ELA8134341.1 His-Xaa-Ser system radical SAM maturase HxsB [Vibrio parahaemolyticus]ELA9874313.1 His-Xaa-Ser system radical SAM maturase HxsB [Vibrio parahaemolyticus]MDA0387287.1 His-Xaa-Ser system radical SAM maturase HxsB [Vibrio parahaemolyticus]
MNKKFLSEDYYFDDGYQLLPFNLERISNDKYLIVNEVGEFLTLSKSDLNTLIDGSLSVNNDIYNSLVRKSFISVDNNNYSYRTFAAKYKSRKSFLLGGPGLHIFVVTLRCENSCEYCQVSRKGIDSCGVDMTKDDARESVFRMFDSPNKSLTVEFQGGEPLLAFGLIEYIVNLTNKLNVRYKKNLQYVITTTLQSIDERMLSFMKTNNIHVSTSLDGPEFLHNKNRKNQGRDSFKKTIHGINLARKYLGSDKVAAMSTLTRESLLYPKEIVDTYIENGFHSIFLRPLNIYGFAAKKEDRISYSPEEYLGFYKKAMDYILEINKGGYHLDEVNASLALNNILTPYSMGYVDLRSPCGDGSGVLVYNYDGKVYPSDESRMLVEMEDSSLSLGSVYQSYEELLSSKPMKKILNSGVAESLAGCSNCVYLPYCGANPIQSYSLTGSMVSHRPSSPFCKKQKGIFQYLFSFIENNEHNETFQRWIMRKSSDENCI